jgi:hypothetical protein
VLGNTDAVAGVKRTRAKGQPVHISLNQVHILMSLHRQCGSIDSDTHVYADGLTLVPSGDFEKAASAASDLDDPRTL